MANFTMLRLYNNSVAMMVYLDKVVSSSAKEQFDARGLSLSNTSVSANFFFLKVNNTLVASQTYVDIAMVAYTVRRSRIRTPYSQIKQPMEIF